MMSANDLWPSVLANEGAKISEFPINGHEVTVTKSRTFSASSNLHISSQAWGNQRLRRKVAAGTSSFVGWLFTVALSGGASLSPGARQTLSSEKHATTPTMLPLMCSPVEFMTQEVVNELLQHCCCVFTQQSKKLSSVIIETFNHPYRRHGKRLLTTPKLLSTTFRV